MMLDMKASMVSGRAKSLSACLLKTRAGFTYANVRGSTHLQAERQLAMQSSRLAPTTLGPLAAARRVSLPLSKHSVSAATPSHKNKAHCGARGMCSSSEVTWTQLPSGARMRKIEAGDQGDTPVIEGQAVRVNYVARFDDCTVCGKGSLSFRIGNGMVCQAIEESAVGMCVGDRRLVRAPPFSRRGKYLASVPNDQLIEYEIMLTGAVHHMNIVTYVERGQDDPLDLLWNFGKRSFEAISGSLQKKPSK